MGHERSERMVVRGRACFLAMAAALLVLGLMACSDTRDPPSPPPWRDQDDFAAVKALAVGEDGTVYVGGNFTRLGPRSGGAVRVDPMTGQPRGRFPVLDGAVLAALPDDAGGWYIGGDFTRANGQPRLNLAHVFADGSLDPAWTPSATFDGTSPGLGVAALARAGGVIYVAGGFSHLSGVARQGLGAVDATGKVTDWAPVLSGGGVLSMGVRDGTVYLGGNFREVNGEARLSLAAVDSSGALTLWNPGASTAYNYMNAMVYSLAIVGDTVLVGGWFSFIGGRPRTALAALDPLSGVPTSWAPSFEYPGDRFGPEVLSVSVRTGIIYAGGNFTSVDGQARHGVAAFDATGTLTPWAPELDGGVVTRVSASGGAIYVTGEFLEAESRARRHLAAFDALGALTSWDPDIDDQSWPMFVDASGDTVLVSGTLGWVGTQTRRAGLAAIDPAGRVTDWNPGVTGTTVPRDGSGMNSGSVLALAVVGDTVYVGGAFITIAGQPRSNLAAVKTSGAVTDWNPAADGPVYALEASENGLTVGGRFSRVGSVARTHLAAFDTSGGLTSWAPAPDAYVTSLAREGTTLYVGGYFTGVGATPRPTLAAFGADGALLPWSPSVTGTLPPVRTSFAGQSPGPVGVASRSPGVAALAAHGGLLYLAGDFTQVGSVDRRGLAAVDSTGAPTPFQVEALASPENPVLPLRALQWGWDRVIAGATVAPFPGSTTDTTVLIADPASSSPGRPAIFTVQHDWYLSDGRPLAEAVAVHGDVAYVGGAFRGFEPFRRWALAAVDRDGGVTDWNPNGAP